MLNAWTVLDDCRYARSLMDDSQTDRQWRHHWFAVVSLLRTVGYVLKNIDAQTSTSHKSAIDAKYKQLHNAKPNPEIFWGFIDRERHMLVKEYAFTDNILHAEHVTAVSYTDWDTGEKRSWEFDQAITSFDVYHATFRDGPFRGKPKLAVVDEAIAWWTDYLRQLETQIEADQQV